MRRIFSFLLMLILYVLSVRTMYAQDNQLWYFAIGNATSNDKQSIIAYTADGTANTLLEGKIDFRYRRQWRIASDAMLGIFNVDGEIDFYYTTSTLIQRLNVSDLFKIPSEALQSSPDLPYAWIISRRSPNYVLLESVSSFLVNNERLFLLIDLKTLTVETITTNEDEINTPRFSEDERYLRYMIEGDVTGKQICSLVEKDLVQNTEQILVTQPRFSFGSCSTADRFGEYWLVKIRKSELGFDQEFQLFSVSKEEETLPDPDDAMEYAIYDNEYLWSYLDDCEKNCDLTRRSLLSGDVDHYILPYRTLYARFFRPLHQFDDSSVLIIVDQAFWLLHPDGNAEIIGYVSLGMMGTTFFPNGLLSPDNRWLLVANTPDDFSIEYRIWDSEKQQYALESENPHGAGIILMNYQHNGFILAEIRGDVRTYKFYRYNDKQLLELPAIGGIYFDVLPDGKILYNGWVDTKEVPFGIYSYDLDQDSYKIVIQDALALTIPPIPSEPLLPNLLG